MNKININKSNILVFDLDGTLLNTDLANFLSYKQALFDKFKIILPNATSRINAKSLNSFLSTSLNDLELSLVKHHKNAIYFNYIPQTSINKSLFDILLLYYKINKTILLTNATKTRAMKLINFHNLKEYFDHIYFNSSGNKYLNLINFFKLNSDNLIVFEDDIEEIKNAKFTGIKQIYCIRSQND